MGGGGGYKWAAKTYTVAATRTARKIAKRAAGAAEPRARFVARADLLRSAALAKRTREDFMVVEPRHHTKAVGDLKEQLRGSCEPASSLGSLRSLGTSLPCRRRWCGRVGELVPSLAEGNRHAPAHASERFVAIG